jgi:hypothetical protein
VVKGEGDTMNSARATWIDPASNQLFALEANAGWVAATLLRL